MNVQYVTDEQGMRTSVLLPIEEYEQMVENMHDLAVVAERRDESTIDFQALKNKLKADGLL